MSKPKRTPEDQSEFDKWNKLLAEEGQATIHISRGQQPLNDGVETTVVGETEVRVDTAYDAGALLDDASESDLSADERDFSDREDEVVADEFADLRIEDDPFYQTG